MVKLTAGCIWRTFLCVCVYACPFIFLLFTFMSRVLSCWSYPIYGIRLRVKKFCVTQWFGSHTNLFLSCPPETRLNLPKGEIAPVAVCTLRIVSAGGCLVPSGLWRKPEGVLKSSVNQVSNVSIFLRPPSFYFELIAFQNTDQSKLVAFSTRYFILYKYKLYILTEHLLATCRCALFCGGRVYSFHVFIRGNENCQRELLVCHLCETSKLRTIELDFPTFSRSVPQKACNFTDPGKFGLLLSNRHTLVSGDCSENSLASDSLLHSFFQFSTLLSICLFLRYWAPRLIMQVAIA